LFDLLVGFSVGWFVCFTHLLDIYIGFGILNKIAIEFEEVFWEEDKDWFGRVRCSAVLLSFLSELMTLSL